MRNEIVSAYLQIANDGMLHVLLLLVQEVIAHTVQRVASQLVITRHHLQI